jgi:hypothetical protein
MSSSRQPGHRVAALFRAEGVLLRRNRVALLNALVLPAALAGWLKASGVDAGVSPAMGGDARDVADRVRAAAARVLQPGDRAGGTP